VLERRPRQFDQADAANGYGVRRNPGGARRDETIPPDDMAKALGADDIETLTQQTGMNRDELLSG